MITICLTFLFIAIFRKTHCKSLDHTDFPSIGILSTPIERRDLLNDTIYTNYITASYVKHLESGGVKPVAILSNFTFQEIDLIMSKVNGIF